MTRWPRWLLLAGAAGGLALVGGVLASNFIGGEKKIERRIERLYALDEPRFMQELGVLLGPPFRAGTRMQALLNGDEIFPPMLAVTAASRSIDLSASYFVPDDLTLHALVEALQRGVRLRNVVPGPHIDSETVRRASRATWGPLLAAGAVIAEYAPTMYHCKVMIDDGLLVSVGSTNFDNRSFRLNDEATLNVVDRAFAAVQTATFEADLAQSRRVTHAQWLARPWRERLGERLASLLGTQL